MNLLCCNSRYKWLQIASFVQCRQGREAKQDFLQSSIEKLILKQINFKQNKFKFLPNDVKDMREGHL